MTGSPTAYDVGKLLVQSGKDGWRIGLIGAPWPGPWPKHCGDLFTAAPNGEQAGIAWETGGPPVRRILGPSEGRWGVFQMRFPIPVMGTDDLIRNFHAVLRLLQTEYLAYRADRDTTAG